MRKMICIVVSVFLIFLTGCGKSENVKDSPSKLQENVSDTSVYVSGMGCSDTACTDLSHHHDCPLDCEDYEHHHNCPLDCDEYEHHHNRPSDDEDYGNYYNCPPDCDEYGHHHNRPSDDEDCWDYYNCPSDCTESSHHHNGRGNVNESGHHRERHHGNHHY